MNTIRDTAVSLFHCCFPKNNSTQSTQSTPNLENPLSDGTPTIYRAGNRPTHPDLTRRNVTGTASTPSNATSSSSRGVGQGQESASLTHHQPSHSGSAPPPARSENQEETPHVLQSVHLFGIDLILSQTPTFHRLSPDEQQVIRMVYDGMRYYHGTSAGSKEGIQRVGLDVSRKTSGPTAALLASEEGAEMLNNASQEELDEFISAAARHNYVTSNKDLAKGYAKLADKNQPALVRVGLGESTVSLELDPHQLDVTEMENGCYRTRHPIPSKYVFPSKSKGTSTEGCETGAGLYSLFQAELEQNGVTVSDEDIRHLFQEVQSDSDDDFESNSDSNSDSNSESNPTPPR